MKFSDNLQFFFFFKTQHPKQYGDIEKKNAVDKANMDAENEEIKRQKELTSLRKMPLSTR